MRLGVALLVPLPVAGEVDGLRRALGDPALARIAAHLTLVPPVNVAEADLGSALAVLRSAAAGLGRLHLELGPVATFWPENPVLYLAVGGPGLGRLVALRERVLRAPLARAQGRPFVPHVTVCDDADPDRIEAMVAGLDRYRAQIVVERVHLLAEGPGRVWRPIADASLAPAVVVGRGSLSLELAVTEGLDPEAAAWAQALVPGAGMAVTARWEGRVVGVVRGQIASLAPSGPTACQASALMVGPGHRDQGVGTALMAALESQAARRGCSWLWACVPAGGRLEGFLRGRGWATGPGVGPGSQPGQVGPGAQLLILWRRLASP